MSNNVKQTVLSVFNAKLLESCQTECKYESTLSLNNWNYKLNLENWEYEFRSFIDYVSITIRYRDHVVEFKVNPRCVSSDIEWLFSKQCQEFIDRLVKAKVQVNSKLKLIDTFKDSLNFWNYEEGHISLNFTLGDMSSKDLPFTLTIVDKDGKFHIEKEETLITSSVSELTDMLYYPLFQS